LTGSIPLGAAAAAPAAAAPDDPAAIHSDKPASARFGAENKTSVLNSMAIKGSEKDFLKEDEKINSMLLKV
jgi:hypothetical protein